MGKVVRQRLGARLRQWRRTRDLSQEQLAERAGLSYKFIGEVERGTGNPTIDTLAKLAQALDVDIADLVTPVDAWKPAELFGLSTRDVQMVREAAKSLDTVVERLEHVSYRRKRRPRS